MFKNYILILLKHISLKFLSSESKKVMILLLQAPKKQNKSKTNKKHTYE